MTINPGIYRPSYLRRAPRWYDGAARLLDLGAVYDLRLPEESDQERLMEDRLVVQEDMRAAVEGLREEVRALNS